MYRFFTQNLLGYFILLTIFVFGAVGVATIINFGHPIGIVYMLPAIIVIIKTYLDRSL